MCLNNELFEKDAVVEEMSKEPPSRHFRGKKQWLFILKGIRIRDSFNPSPARLKEKHRGFVHCPPEVPYTTSEESVENVKARMQLYEPEVIETASERSIRTPSSSSSTSTPSIEIAADKMTSDSKPSKKSIASIKRDSEDAATSKSSKKASISVYI